MLEYRIRRLGAARRNAQAHGRRGARFPWESAADGTDVTPRQAIDPTGKQVQILTGDLEVHIVADVAWAARCYVDWTGDTGFWRTGTDLVVESARYWASRVRFDAHGRAHIDGVIGPDEYHESVDDNAFTNVMARWNLNAAANLATEGLATAGTDEVSAWRALADALVDGLDPDTGRYEQFAGFSGLEPLLISELAEPPIAADLLLGSDRVQRSQVIKQADVLMLHHLVPDEVAPGSLPVNLDHYLPRTAHGSSLSPAIHASLLARAGRPDDARELLALACRVDLDDLTGMTASGLHVATMGGVWQALVYGFAGVRPSLGGALTIDPCLPAAWARLEVRLRYLGGRLRLCLAADEIRVTTDQPVQVQVRRRGGGGRAERLSAGETVFVWRHDDWERKRS
jgi:trehalose/maltose hydrolase-like predicted phosphorylase